MLLLEGNLAAAVPGKGHAILVYAGPSFIPSVVQGLRYPSVRAGERTQGKIRRGPTFLT
jgi:hypothetical protein